MRAHVPQSRNEYGKIVLVTEMPRDLRGRFPGFCCALAGCRKAQRRFEILGVLAAFVARSCAAGSERRLELAPTLPVGPAQPALIDRRRVVRHAPARGALEALLEQPARLACRALRADGGKGARVPQAQLRAKAEEHLTVFAQLARGEKLVDELKRDARVACRSQRARGIPQGGVLARAGALADRVAEKSQGRARPLERLSHGVDGLVAERPLCEQRERALDLHP